MSIFGESYFMGGPKHLTPLKWSQFKECTKKDINISVRQGQLWNFDMLNTFKAWGKKIRQEKKMRH